MPNGMTSVSPDARGALRCPVCHSTLAISADSVQCQNVACGVVFPLSRGIPVLLNEANSVFRLLYFAGASPRLLDTDGPSIIAWLKRLVPDNGYNLSAERNFGKLG